MKQAGEQRASHTPGPWHLDPEDLADPDALVIGVLSESDELIGSACGFIAEELSPGVWSPGLRGDIETVRANAHLFKAAPGLLQAAQAAWNCIGELPPTQARVEVAQMLQAAIERATGAAS